MDYDPQAAERRKRERRDAAIRTDERARVEREVVEYYRLRAKDARRNGMFIASVSWGRVADDIEAGAHRIPDSEISNTED